MTNEPKWTEGPWAFGTNTNGLEICTLHGLEPQPTEDGRGQSWVYVSKYREVGEPFHCPDETEQLANARLIAAAPDMEAALPDLSAVISWLENGCDPKEAAKELRIYAARIDRAKAKARGES